MNVRRMVGKALGLGLLMILVALVLSACGGGGKAGNTVSREGDEVDQIRDIERQRLRALVEANMDVARRLHADDFQLINPFGGALSKEEYLGAVASGEVDYIVFEPDSAIEVRLYGEAAVIRYQSRIEIVVGGRAFALRGWHTDAYERRGGR